MLLSFTLPNISLPIFQTHSYQPSLRCPSTEPFISEITDLIEDIKMTEEGTSTPDGIPLAPVIQIPYIMAMPYPKTPGTPFFEDSNITDFLNQYDLICIDFRKEEKEKLWRLPL